MDQTKELDLPTTLYARIMARTYAVLCWSAHVDGNDVEFVLAPPRALISKQEFTTQISRDETSTAHNNII